MRAAELVDRYLAHCRARKLSRKTLQAYAWALRYLPDPAPDTPEPIEDVLASLPLAVESVRDVHRVFRAIYRWGARRRLVQDVMQEIPPPIRRRRFPRTFTQPELQRIWETCRSDRDRALIAFALATGARLGEISSLTWSAVNQGAVQIDGKTGSRVVPIPQDLQSLLVGLGDVTHVWVGRRGPLDKRGVQQVFKRLVARAGIEGRKRGPHTFRHTFATEYIRAGGNVFTLQRILGHSSVDTSMLYVHMVEADLARDVEAFSPLRLVLGRKGA